jgi:hypothetical protein
LRELRGTSAASLPVVTTIGTSRSSLVLGAVVVAIAAVVAIGDLELQLDPREADTVGPPLTPMSSAAVYGAYSPTVVAALPAGCATVRSGGVVQYRCGADTYVARYDGPDVVYVPVL